ncbi:dolichyl-diphosphooligosaccharide--protein glycosyltransferase subunit 2 [Vanessa tameamea]|uniref:Dolichyl-diphosphooligosaccharide--protein glycosyltransferase subunit 2 n=1 Tax=Vanessa tameamea TaxID=334116 RepID=A0A8B8I6G7_VANTA|nr:dolichyl-diphosphooligosaccharide--protein glycosyltransferase subunit 2 [Vanessa tameamea]
MSRCFLPLLLLSVLAVSHAILQGTVDVKRLQRILEEGVKSKDISTLYYSLKGLKQLNAKIPDVCNVIQNTKYDLKNIEQIFHLTNAADLSGCQNSLKPDVLSAPTQVLDKKDATIPDLYHAVYSLKALGKGSIYDKEDSLKNLIQLLKKDDSPANYGYVFTLCEHIGCTAWTATHAESALLAADETDGRSLHFDGGLPVTSLVLSTIIRTYKSLGKPSPLSTEQRYKFGAYVLSRRSVTSPRGAALLLDAAAALAADQPTPISIVFKDKKFITSDSDSIEFSVTDLIGRPIPNLKPDEVIAQSGTRLADDVVVLSKQPLTQKSNEPTTFILNLSKIKSQHGLYKISLSAGTKSANFNIAVLGEIQVSSIEVGIGDVDGTTSPKVTTVTYPNKLTEKLQADHLQKVTLKFTVRDKWNKPVVVQQAFVRIAPANAPHEAIYVAEPDAAGTYKVELNVGAMSAHLQHSGGAHELSVLLGDSAVAAPLAWTLGDLVLNFARDNAVGEPVKTTKSPYRGPLPEIAHEFRSAEARPSRLVSDVFALACGAPLLLLLLLWARLGLNFSLFPPLPLPALTALLFHIALGGSLALYGMLWLQLTMFETLRYLLPLGAVTFLSGHRLLRGLVRDKASR